MDERVNHSAVLATVTGVDSECGRSGIRDEGGRNDTSLAASKTNEHLEDGLELGVIERIGRAVSVHAKCVDSGLVARVKSSGGVGRVGDERVNGVGHLVAELEVLLMELLIDSCVLVQLTTGNLSMAIFER